MEELIEISRQDLKKALALWESSFRQTPSEFYTHEQVREMGTNETSEGASLYLWAKLKEVLNVG